MGRYIYQAVLTPDAGGGYSVEVPDLPGCLTCGDDYRDAVFMAADAIKTCLASLLKHGEHIPVSSFLPCDPGSESVMIYVEANAGYVIDGEIISAAEASRRLRVSPGRVTRLLDAGILEGYREGRHTFISAASVERRLACTPKAGRPTKRLASA